MAAATQSSFGIRIGAFIPHSASLIGLDALSPARRTPTLLACKGPARAFHMMSPDPSGGDQQCSLEVFFALPPTLILA